LIIDYRDILNRLSKKLSTNEKSDKDVENYEKLFNWYKNDRRYSKIKKEN